MPTPRVCETEPVVGDQEADVERQTVTPVQPGSKRHTVSTLHGLPHGEVALRHGRNEAHVVFGCRLGTRHDLGPCRCLGRRLLGARPGPEDPEQHGIRGGQVDIVLVRVGHRSAVALGGRRTQLVDPCQGVRPAAGNAGDAPFLTLHRHTSRVPAIDAANVDVISPTREARQRRPVSNENLVPQEPFGN